jgi:hypothetical protein
MGILSPAGGLLIYLSPGNSSQNPYISVPIPFHAVPVPFQEAAGHGGDVKLREGSVLFQSMTTTLLYCCRNHRGQEVGVVRVYVMSCTYLVCIACHGKPRGTAQTVWYSRAPVLSDGPASIGTESRLEGGGVNADFKGSAWLWQEEEESYRV